MRLKFVLGAVFVLALHEVTSQGQFEPGNTESLDVVANSVTNLAQKISRAIASPRSKTEIFSPVSIAGALSLLLLGSSGVTRDELTKLMGFDNQKINFAEIHKSFGKLFHELVSPEPSLNTPIPWRQNDKCNNYDYEDDEEPSPPPKNQRGKRDTSSHQISVANGVFVDQHFQLGARYERLTKCLYQGVSQRLPFNADPRSTARQINDWAQESTNGKIREIVTPEQVQNSPMVLASALYFKGKWETMFVEPDTRPRPFYVNGRNQAPVNVTAMATSGCFPYLDVKDWDAKLVGLPYEQGLSTMYLLFPNNSDRQKLSALLGRVDLGQLNSLIDRMEVKTGVVVMPKMKLENNLGLKQVLSSLGISTLFDTYKSNLSVITTTTYDQDGDIDKSCEQVLRPERPIKSRRPSTTSTPNFVFRVGMDSTDNQRPVQPAEQYQPPRHTLQQSNKVIIPVAESRDCFFIRNCMYEGNQCKCVFDPVDAQDQEACPLRPFYVAQNCADKVLSFEGWTVCHSKQYRKVESIRDSSVCQSNNCVSFDGQCYCCTTQQQNPQSQVPQQQPQIASRFGPGTPAQNPQQPQVSQSNVPRNPQNVPPVQQRQPLSPDQRQDSFSNQNSFQQLLPPPAPQVSHTSSHNQNQPPQALISCFNERKCSHLQGCQPVLKCYLTGQQLAQPLTNLGGRSRPKRQTIRRPNLFVGDIVHKVSLDIDESGTEGGAVTAVVIDRISSSFALRMDGPFLIYLRHDITKLPLFYGPVYDPRE